MNFFSQFCWTLLGICAFRRMRSGHFMFDMLFAHLDFFLLNFSTNNLCEKMAIIESGENANIPNGKFDRKTKICKFISLVTELPWNASNFFYSHIKCTNSWISNWKPFAVCLFLCTEKCRELNKTFQAFCMNQKLVIK